MVKTTVKAQLDVVSKKMKEDKDEWLCDDLKTIFKDVAFWGFLFSSNEFKTNRT